MKKQYKTLICTLLLLLFGISLVSCVGSNLAGTYVGESGSYTFVFKRDGSCTLRLMAGGGEFALEGDYTKEGNEYVINVKGLSGVASYVYRATPVEGGLRINGSGIVNEFFTKK